MSYSGTLEQHTADYWLEKDKLLLLESYVLDGFNFRDIASLIGVPLKSLEKWKSQYPEISKALSARRDIVDAKVENALVKSALGYKKTDVKVTTVMKYGKVIETIKETTETDQAPNITAIQFYLCNRKKDKWKSITSKSNVFDEMADDDKIEIVVRRAGQKGASDEDSESEDNFTNETGSQVTDANITLRKRSKQEQEEHKAKRVAEAKQKALEQEQDVSYEDDEPEAEVSADDIDWDEADE